MKPKQTKPAAGGARPGAGRKAALTEGGASEVLRVRLTPRQKQIAAKLGNGNVSEGVRLALERASR